MGENEHTGRALCIAGDLTARLRPKFGHVVRPTERVNGT